MGVHGMALSPKPAHRRMGMLSGSAGGQAARDVSSATQDERYD